MDNLHAMQCVLCDWWSSAQGSGNTLPSGRRSRGTECAGADGARGRDTSSRDSLRPRQSARYVRGYSFVKIDRHDLQRTYPKGVALRRMGTDYLSPEYRADYCGLALECQWNVERRGASERIFYGKRRPPGVLFSL